MSEDELGAALEDGWTIAEIDGEQGVDVQRVVDATVNAGDVVKLSHGSQMLA